MDWDFQPPGEVLCDNLQERCAGIKLLILDVDGVLTDGKLNYDLNGGEIKSFFVRDGLGIRMLIWHEIDVAIISGRRSAIVERRAQELGITQLYQLCLEKLNAYEELKAKNGLQDEQIGHIGDDLLDLPLFRRVGLAAGVADGDESVREAVHYVTEHPGGYGAVREVCDMILRAKGLWAAATRNYYR